MIQQELAGEKRIVLDTPGFVAFCPFASRFPFETWMLPKNHFSHYENIQKNGVDDLAGVLKQVIGKIEASLDRPAYNYIIHTSPFDTPELAHYHWHIEIIPSLTKPAGFEWGTGFYINPVPPEEAAAFLREIEADNFTRNKISRSGKLDNLGWACRLSNCPSPPLAAGSRLQRQDGLLRGIAGSCVQTPLVVHLPTELSCEI